MDAGVNESERRQWRIKRAWSFTEQRSPPNEVKEDDYCEVRYRELTQDAALSETGH